MRNAEVEPGGLPGEQGQSSTACAVVRLVRDDVVEQECPDLTSGAAFLQSPAEPRRLPMAIPGPHGICD